VQYATNINDASVWGITAARQARNAALSPTIEQDGQQVPNPELIASDSAYLDFVLASAIESWCHQYAPVVVPEVPPVVVAGVPQSVTMRQAQLALLGAGLLDTVNAAIAAMAGDAGRAAQITWATSSAVERGNPLIAALAGALGLTDAAIDALFIQAATL
jgi:hypothetical protein